MAKKINIKDLKLIISAIKKYVDSKDNIEIDLSKYATKEYVDKGDQEATSEEVKELIEEVLGGEYNG